MAFVVAGIVFVVTLVATFVVALANGMSDNPADNNKSTPIAVLVVGGIITLLVASSHWLHATW